MEFSVDLSQPNINELTKGGAPAPLKGWGVAPNTLKGGGGHADSEQGEEQSGENEQRGKEVARVAQVTEAGGRP